MFTYDEAGNNAWYIASGQVNDEGLFSADLLQTAQGEYLLNENPQSAQVTGAVSTINILFTGSQVATLSIDNSEPKSIRADHFALTSNYKIPDLSGKWVMGDAITGKSYILDFTLIPTVVFGGVSLPYRDVTYSSSHVSTENWQLQCTIFLGLELDSSQCDLVRGSGFDDLKVNTFDIGNQRMTLFSQNPENPEKYQAFRLDKDRRLLPNDGHWRTHDDPDIGSGMVMRTQADYTVVLLYSYDEAGNAIWQIASGQFDVNGKMVADLNFPNDGTAIDNLSPETAICCELAQTIVIQLKGTELATFSIDGSVPKSMQNTNFAVALSQTVNYLVNNEPFVFPNEAGNWLFIDHDYDELKTGVISIQDYSGSISPLPPGAPPTYWGSYRSDGYDLSLFFVCPRTEVSFLVDDSCSGRITRSDQGVSDLIIYFQDIGVDGIRIYSETPVEPGRAYQVIDLYRLTD